MAVWYGTSVPFGPMVLLLAGAPAPMVAKRPGNPVDEPPQENLPEFEVA